MDNNQEADGQASPDSSPESRHKLENLKMAQIKTSRKDESAQSSNEWTVVYSDSNSSVLSGSGDDDDETIDISVVDEEIIEKDYEEDGDDVDDLEEDEEVSDNKENVLLEEHPPTAPQLIQFGTMKKLDEISLTDTGSKIQIWEQMVDSATTSGTEWKPILVTAVDGSGEDTPPSPPPSFADNEYESSDIDIINDEDELDTGLNDDHDSIMSLSISSIISQSSNLSLLREQYLKAHLSKQANRRGFNFKYFAPKDSAASDDDDEPIPNQSYDDSVPMTKSGRIRAYVHTPNTGLNGKLNLILILTVATVLGLGIGHFLGWSNQWRQQKQLSMGQVIKLKQLQDDLLVCMKTQDSLDSENYVGNSFKVCHRDSDYWKQRIETLFDENKGLIELFQKTQKHFHENGHHDNVIEEHECVNKTTSDEFHKLKLDFLVNQMEHLKLLEVLYEVKTKGQQSEKRVKVLEGENLDLKKKLVEEEEDDQELEETWGNRVAVLQNENEELRKTIVEDDVEDMKVIGSLRQKMDALNQENREMKQIIDRLEQQLNGVVINRKWKSRRYKGDLDYEDEQVDTSYAARYNLLRDRINQMMSENEELKAKVARYRWTSESRANRKHDQVDSDDEEQKEKFSNEKTHHRDEANERKMEVLTAKIGVLGHQLQIEQNESRRWKEKFESSMKKMKRMQDKQKRENFKESRDDSQSDDSDEDTDEEQPPDQKQTKQKPRSKWNSFHAKWNQKFESLSERSRKFFNGFYEKMRTKWDKLHKKYNADMNENGQPLSGDRLIKIGQFLENAIENVHNFSENLFQKGMRSEVVTYLSDRMTDFANMIEKNLNPHQDANNQAQPEQTKAEDHNKQYYEATEQEALRQKLLRMKKFETRDQEQVDEENMFVDTPASELDNQDSESLSGTPPPYPSMGKKKRDWLAERAKAREKYRRDRLESNFDDEL